MDVTLRFKKGKGTYTNIDQVPLLPGDLLVETVDRITPTDRYLTEPDCKHRQLLGESTPVIVVDASGRQGTEIYRLWKVRDEGGREAVMSYGDPNKAIFDDTILNIVQKPNT